MVVLKGKHSPIDGDEFEKDEELDTIGDDSESDQESESDDEEDDVKLSEPAKNAIYNKEGLLDKLGDISWPADVDWIHTLAIVIDEQQEVDVNDDLAREAAFYTQALHGAREGTAKLELRGQPYLRPSDYYAEMVKSDSHMQKVRNKLLIEKKHLEEQEQRKKEREQKRFSKQVQADKQKERAKDKKQQIESVKKWRKQRERSGFADNKEEMVLPFEGGGAPGRNSKRPSGVAPGDRTGGKGKVFANKGKKGIEKKRKNRDFRDSKFGFGGRKGTKKQNTADTTADLRGFNSNSSSANKKRKMS